MKKVGSRIYYSLLNGEVLVNTGDRITPDDYETPSEDDDFTAFTKLSERNRDTVGVVEFEFGKFDADFKEGGVIDVIDVNTSKPLFTYPDPVDPETPQEPRPALSEQVGSLGGQMAEMKLQGIENQTVVNSLGGELTSVKMQSIQQQQTITSLGQELAAAKLEIIQLKGGEPT